jgi:hypothetical protein
MVQPLQDQSRLNQQSDKEGFMKRLVIVAAALAIALPAWAGPKDKSAETLVDPTSITGNLVTWNNATVTAKVKAGKCKVKIQFKDALAALNGQQVICVAGADVRATALPPGLFGNSIVMAGTVADGKLKISADLSQIGCGDQNAININSTISCYAQDADYTDANDLNPGNWKQVCINAATVMAALPIVGDPPLADDLLGLCQGFTAGAGERIDPPASALIAVQGGYNPLAD